MEFGLKSEIYMPNFFRGEGVLYLIAVATNGLWKQDDISLSIKSFRTINGVKKINGVANFDEFLIN